MAKEKNNQEEFPEDQELTELLERYEEEKRIFQKKMKDRDRFTANEIFNMKNAIEGIRMSPSGEVHKTSGIGDLKGEQYVDFNTKIGRNLQIIKNELTIITGVCPSLKGDEKKAHEKYQQELEDLQEKNINKKNITGSHARLSIVEKIRLSGNLEIYEEEKTKLDKKYKKLLDRIDEINKISNKIFDKPVCKCEFDMILESEIPPEVSPNELQAIYPMIKNDITKEESKENEED